MADLSQYIALNVEFNLSGSPKLIFTDPNNYPAGVAAGITGIISLTQPDGVPQNGNFSNPDIVWISGMLTSANKNLRPSTTKNYQEGVYQISYTIHCAGYDPTTLTRTVDFKFCAPKLNLSPNFDTFTPYLNVSDKTCYNIPSYSVIANTNSWSAQVGSVGMVNASNVSIFDLKLNGNYYDALYTINYSNTVTYQNSVYSWVTVVYQFGSTITAAADTPPQMDTLVSYLTALKTQLDNSQQCDPCGCSDGLKCTYMYAEAILAHTQMRLCSGDLAVEDYVNQFIKLTHNGQLPVYVNTNTAIQPYVLTFCKTGAGAGAIAHISITSTDFEPDGITYLNPLAVPDNISLFFSDLPAYIYQDAGQWQYVTGGIKILIPGFDANSNSYHLELDVKQIS